MLHRYERPRIVGKEEQRNSLNNAYQSQLNINDNSIEFSATFIELIHQRRVAVQTSKCQETTR